MLFLPYFYEIRGFVNATAEGNRQQTNGTGN